MHMAHGPIVKRARPVSDLMWHRIKLEQHAFPMTPD
jgi:hypothetical protein